MTDTENRNLIVEVSTGDGDRAYVTHGKEVDGFKMVQMDQLLLLSGDDPVGIYGRTEWHSAIFHGESCECGTPCVASGRS